MSSLRPSEQLWRVLHTLETLSLKGVEGVNADGTFRARHTFDSVPEPLFEVELQPDVRAVGQGQVDFSHALKKGFGSELVRRENRDWQGWFRMFPKEAIAIPYRPDLSPKPVLRYRRPTGEIVTIVGLQTTMRGLPTGCACVYWQLLPESPLIPWKETFCLSTKHSWVELTPKGWDVLRAADDGVGKEALSKVTNDSPLDNNTSGSSHTARTRALTDRQRNILRALFEGHAFDRETRMTTEAIAESAEGKAANPETFKQAVAELALLEFVETVRGRQGGVWLSPEGKSFAESIK